jgi:hypothetical protein
LVGINLELLLLEAQADECLGQLLPFSETSKVVVAEAAIARR